MIDKIKNILPPVVVRYLEIIQKYFSIAISKINTGWWWLLDKIYRLLCNVFGEEKVESTFVGLYQKIDSAKNWFSSKFDTEGSQYPTIKKVYKFTAKSLIGVLIYWFCIETNFLWLCGRMPSVEQLANPTISQSSTIYTADGEEIGKFFTENRQTIDSSQMSPWLFKALIATEDKRFYKHSGIDLESMAGVAIGLFKGGERGGGSTISQQLAKNLYNTRKNEMRGLLYHIPIISTIIYKTKEWLTAIRLERRFTKGEIATMYLNAVPYGNNAFGIKTAAKTYFSKKPDELSVEEAAVLVGLQKGTTLYNPIRNPKNALKRRNTVLHLMAENGDISKEKVEKLSKTEIDLNVDLSENDGQGSYFKTALSRFIEKWAEQNNIDIDLYRDGLKIYTTLDSRMQTHAENAVASHMKRLQKIFDQEWKNKNPWIYESGQEIPGFIDTVAKRTNYYKKLEKKYKGNLDSISFYMNQPRKMKIFDWDSKNLEKEVVMSSMDSIRYFKRFLQAGTMAMDPYNGFIKAWVGGINYDYFKYDHVKQGRRQPGSTFKPVVYTAAIDGPLNLSPCDRRRDEPLKDVKDAQGNDWIPKNADGKFSYSSLTLRRAIARSVNSIAVQLTKELKSKTVIEYARKLGITAPLDDNLALGLGVSDVSLYELVAAYGIFVNGGTYVEPMLVFRIEDSKGKVIHEFESKKRENAIKPESAFLMQYMLRGGVEESGGTSRGLFEYASSLFANGGQAAGKTGTTSNYSDAWYMGFTKDLVCGVWVGGDDRSIHFRSRMGEGARSALPIFGKFMHSVYTDKKLGYSGSPFPKPDFKIEKDYQNCGAGELGGIISDSTAVGSDSGVVVRDSAKATQQKQAVKDSTKKEKDEQL